MFPSCFHASFADLINKLLVEKGAVFAQWLFRNIMVTNINNNGDISAIVYSLSRIARKFFHGSWKPADMT